jgi:hypothetical protein
VSRNSRLVIAASAFLLSLCLAVPALGAPARWDSVDVTARAADSGTLLLVSGALAEDAKLPADVEISVPAGAELLWAGEILGGAPDADPTVTTTKASSGGSDVYKFTLTTARRGQVEVAVPSVVTFDGSAYGASLAWTSATPVPTVNLSMQVPQNAPLVRPAEGASLEPAEDGSSYYTRTFTDVEAGQPLALEFAYGAPAVPAATTTSQGSTATWVPVLLAVGVLAGLALLVRGVSRKLSDKRELSGAADAGTAHASASSVAGDGDGSEAAEAEPPRRRARPATVVLAVVGVLVAAAAFAVSSASRPQLADGAITRSFGGEASACTSATIAVQPAAGVDLADKGSKVLDAFNGMQGIGAVTLHVDDARIDVQFCESTTSEQAIRAALSGTGLVTF